MNILLIDTYPHIKKISFSSNDIVQKWINEYMKNYPQLLELQIRCHNNDISILKAMASKLLKYSIRREEEITKAWRNIYPAIPVVTERAQKIFTNLPNKIYIIIYVGSGCGAGWATEYNGEYAILLGLEMIVYHNWTSHEDIEGLVAHELCHIIHMYLRNMNAREFEKLEEQPCFLLYSEGFAMKCEHILTNRMWRIADKNDWVDYCVKNKDVLAKEYLESFEKGLSTIKFWSSWQGIDGYTQTGYYLGYEFIEYLMREYSLSLEEIAKIGTDHIRRLVIEFLKAIRST